MPSLKFCDLPPSDAAAQVKRMLGHAPSQQAAHTFWMNLLTLGQIQQNQRLEIDSQGVFRLESTASRKLNTLSPFRSASRSITELHPAVLAVLYRAQIESFFPTPQLSKVLGSNRGYSPLAITENQPYNRDGNRRSSFSRSVGAIAREGVVAPPRDGNFYAFFGNLTANAEQVVSHLAQANAGLANMLQGYRSQSSWFNSKDAQAESVSDLAKQAEKPLMPFGNKDGGASIGQLLAFKHNTLFDPSIAPFWDLDSTAIANSSRSARNDATRVINTARGMGIVKGLDSTPTRASLLLWGHHELRDGWVYDEIDFDLFDDDINENSPSSRVLEEQVDETQCNVSALKQWGACVERHQQRITAMFP
jgi:hypothetical protein